MWTPRAEGGAGTSRAGPSCGVRRGGRIAFAGNVEVAPGLMGVRGRFRVLAADGAVTGGENVRGWTVAEENANAFSFALEADEQGVWLVARPKGTVLLLR